MRLQKYTKDGRETAIRFKLPRFEAANTVYSDDAPTQVVWDKFHGRPYIFPRAMFLTKTEIEAQTESKNTQTNTTTDNEQLPF